MAIKHVAVTGSDSGNDGNSLATAYRSIFKGLNNIGANDLLTVHAGDYYETINSSTAGLTIPAGTSWGDAPLIQANAGDTVRLLVGGGTNLVNLVHSYIKYVEFDGLQLLGVNGIEQPVLDNVISLSSCTYVRFRNCIIRDSKINGVFASKGSITSPYTTGHEFINCDNYGHGDPVTGHGYYISTSDNLIQYGSIHGNASYGAHFYQASGDVTQNNTIDGVRIYGNGTVVATAAGILLSNGTGHKAINNIVYDNPYGIRVGNYKCDGALVANNTCDGHTYSGLHLDNASGLNHDGTIFENNISTNNGQYGLDIDAGVVNTTYGYNLWYGNGTAPKRDNGTSSVDQGNDVTTDPLYADRGEKDFTLPSGSPARNAGKTIVAVTADFLGVARPQESVYDIGAYEFDTPSNAPVNTLPAFQAFTKDTQAAISVMVSDADADIASVTFTCDEPLAQLNVTASGLAVIS